MATTTTTTAPPEQRVPSSNDEEKAEDQLSSHSDPQGEKVQDGPAEAEAEVEPPKPAGPPGGPPPDGGTKAWLQVVGGFFLFFNTWGILNTFGVYQTYYESGALFQTSSSNISWVGAIQSFVLLVSGALAGPLFDRGYLRVLLIWGTFWTVFGHMMLSLCHEFWQVILAQGFCIGIGGGALFVPAVAIVPTYFSTKFGLAVGLVASGSSMGGIIYPIVFYRLIDQIGFGWSVRVLGFMALATLLIPLVLMQTRVQPAKARALIDWSMFTDWPFIIFVLGAMVGFIGLYVGIFYFSYFAQAQHLTDDSLSFYLVAILNAGSVFGRTLPNWLSDKIGPMNVIIPGSIVTGIIVLCNLAVHNTGGIVVTTLFFGFFSGIFIALPPVIFVRLTADKSKAGTRIGTGFAILGGGVLAGGPGAGAILGHGQSMNWTGVWVYGGVVLLGAAIVFMGVRTMKVGLVLKAKI